MHNAEPLKVTLVRIAGAEVVLTMDDSGGHELRLPKSSVPKSAKLGDQFVLELMPTHIAHERRDTVARKLLEDILNGK